MPLLLVITTAIIVVHLTSLLTEAVRSSDSDGGVGERRRLGMETTYVDIMLGVSTATILLSRGVSSELQVC